MSQSEAMMQIMAIRAQTEVMGANDYEGSAFLNLEERLKNGKITPEEALQEAGDILQNKQDYH